MQHIHTSPLEKDECKNHSALSKVPRTDANLGSHKFFGSVLSLEKRIRDARTHSLGK